MNKKLIISLVILTIVTAVAGYFLYQWYSKNNPPSNFGTSCPIGQYYMDGKCKS
jgi:flagellar basal body-associated protein FliL